MPATASWAADLYVNICKPQRTVSQALLGTGAGLVWGIFGADWFSRHSWAHSQRVGFRDGASWGSLGALVGLGLTYATYNPPKFWPAIQAGTRGLKHPAFFPTTLMTYAGSLAVLYFTSRTPKHPHALAPAPLKPVGATPETAQK